MIVKYLVYFNQNHYKYGFLQFWGWGWGGGGGREAINIHERT